MFQEWATDWAGKKVGTLAEDGARFSEEMAASVRHGDFTRDEPMSVDRPMLPRTNLWMGLNLLDQLNIYFMDGVLKGLLSWTW